MRLQVKVVCRSLPLMIRRGASMSYPVVGGLSIGTIVNVNDIVKPGGGWQWYKLEDGRGWICKTEPGAGYDYVKTLKDLDPPKQPPKPTPQPPKPVPKPKPAPKPAPAPNPWDDAYNNKSGVITNPSSALWAETVTPAEQFVANNKAQSIQSVKSNARLSYPEKVARLDNIERAYSKTSARKLYAGSSNRYIQDTYYETEDSKYSECGVYDFSTDYSFIEAELNKIRRNLDLDTGGGFKELQRKLFHQFNRYQMTFPDYHAPKMFHHIFFTRPDLNIMADGCGSLTPQADAMADYYYLYRNNPDLLKSLSASYTTKHDFLPFIGNGACSFESSDEYIKTVDHGQTFTGNRIVYGTNNVESRASGEFSVNFEDDRNLDILKTFKTWHEYISRVNRNEMQTKERYIQETRLDYAVSAYHVVTASDHTTILYWTKYFGVFPTNSPSSALSWSKGSYNSKPEMTVNFKYSFKEDMDPVSLAELNHLNHMEYIYRVDYDYRHCSAGRTFTGPPFIETIVKNGRYDFKLRFCHNTND